MKIAQPKNLIICASLALLTACSSTRIQSTRFPAGVAAGPFRNITVVGIDERAEVRNPFEDDVVEMLSARGIQANASHTRFTLSEMKGNREQIRQRLLQAHAESVLFVKATGRSDYVSESPVSLGGIDVGAVDESRYNAFTAPGGTIRTDVALAAKLYRVSDGAVVWSGILDTVLNENYDSIAVLHKVAKTIVNQMVSDKVIP